MSLALADRNWVIFVNLVAILRRNEFVTGNVKHRFEHALVADSAGPQLRLDHAAALGEERIDLGLCRHGLMAFRIARIFTLTRESSLYYVSNIVSEAARLNSCPSPRIICQTSF